MLPFHGHGAGGSIRGWLTGSHLSFPSARQIFTYVNARYVRDRLVSHALVAGYSTLLMHGRYPAAAVFIDVPSEDVDVNVHPAKSEVRFRRGGAVHDLITRAVHERLRSQSPAAGAAAAPSASAPLAAVSLAATPPPASVTDVDEPLRQLAIALRPLPGDARLQLVALPPTAGRAAAPGARAETPDTVVPAFAPTIPLRATPRASSAAARPGFFAGLRVIGQAFEGYLLCEGDESLLVIDQHAAHERVTFERLRHAYADGGVTRQRVLVPVVVDVGAQAAPLVTEHLAALEDLGFELEPFGGSSFAVRALPALLTDVDPAALVRDLAEELTEVGRSRRLTQAAESVLARLACHSAVRVGQTLGADQIRALLVAMDSIDFAGNCPHGRPAFITLPRSDLERLFKRT